MHRLSIAAVSLFAVAAFAQTQDTAPNGPPRGHPPEAIAACNGLSEGTACGFTGRGQNLTGTCRKGPDGGSLACAPAGMGPGGPGGHHGPPQEAITACQSQSNGAACSFSHDGRTLTGTCDAPPNGTTLACRPAGMGPGGHHGPPPEALSACAQLAAGAACSVTLRGQNLNGTCTRGPHGEALACMPARP